MLSSFIGKLSESYVKYALCPGIFLTFSLSIIFNNLFAGSLNIYAKNEIIFVFGFTIVSLIIGGVNSLFSALVIYDLFCVIYNKYFKDNLMGQFEGLMGIGSGYFVMCSHLILPTAFWGWAFPYFIKRPEYIFVSVLCWLFISFMFFVLGFYSFLRFLKTETLRAGGKAN